MTADSSSDITDLSATALVTPKWLWQSLCQAVRGSPQTSPAEPARKQSPNMNNVLNYTEKSENYEVS